MSTNDLITAYGTGSADIIDLRKALQHTWDDLRQDPASLQAISNTLNIPCDAVARMEAVPIVLKQGPSGLGAVETAILVLVGEAIYDVAKDISKDIAKDAIRKAASALWYKILLPYLQKLLKRGDLGEETSVSISSQSLSSNEDV